MINVVGIGPGAREYILPVAIDALNSSSLIIGYKRVIDSLDFVDRPKRVVNSLKEVLDIIDSYADTISVVASGDPMFYGIGDYLNRHLSKDISIVPGISSFQYLASKLKKKWNQAYLGSFHGREDNLSNIQKSSISIFLCDNTNTPKSICHEIAKLGGKYVIYIGERLSYQDEVIRVGEARELMHKDYDSLAVMIVEREGDFD